MSDLNTVEGGLEYIANSPPAWAAGGFHRYTVQIAKQAQAEIVTLRATTREQAATIAAKDATIAALRAALVGIKEGWLCPGAVQNFIDAALAASAERKGAQ